MKIQTFYASVRFFLALTLILWNTPRFASAAVFTADTAEAAVIATDAEAAGEAGLVGPAANGTGFLGGIWDNVQSIFKSVPEELPAEKTVAVEEIKTADSTDAKAAEGVVVEEVATSSAPEIAVPAVVPTELTEETLTPAQDAAVQNDQEEKVLFPVLYEGKNAATATAATVEEGFLAANGQRITIGVLLLAIALGIILPLSLGNGSGSSDGFGGGSGAGDLNDGGSGIGGGSGNGNGDDLNDLDGGPNGNGIPDPTNPVPEPYSLALFGMGLVGLFLKRNRLTQN